MTLWAGHVITLGIACDSLTHPHTHTAITKSLYSSFSVFPTSINTLGLGQLVFFLPENWRKLTGKNLISTNIDLKTKIGTLTGRDFDMKTVIWQIYHIRKPNLNKFWPLNQIFDIKKTKFWSLNQILTNADFTNQNLTTFDLLNQNFDIKTSRCSPWNQFLTNTDLNQTKLDKFRP